MSWSGGGVGERRAIIGQRGAVDPAVGVGGIGVWPLWASPVSTLSLDLWSFVICIQHVLIILLR